MKLSSLMTPIFYVLSASAAFSVFDKRGSSFSDPQKTLVGSANLSLTSESRTSHEFSTLESQRLDYLSEVFLHTLNTFATKPFFNCTVFEIFEPSLKSQLADLETLSQGLTLKVPELTSRIRFARFMLETMIQLRKKIQEEMGSADLPCQWVICVFHLNIRILALRETQIDQRVALKIYEYVSVVERHLEFLQFWVEMSKYIPQFSREVRSFLGSQASMAEAVQARLVNMK